MPSRKTMNRKARKTNRKTNRKTLNRKSNRKSRINRKSNRKSRINRRNYKKSTRRQQGGSFSLRQGQEFASYHKNQHGGALTGAPISSIGGSMLPTELRSFARVDGLDSSYAAASAMRDPDQVHVQMGGRRKMRSKTRSNTCKNSKSRSKKQRGGALSLMGAPLSQSNMLISATDANKAGIADFRDPLLKL